MLKIELQPFSGPMDLLLELLSQSKLDIYDIEISSITEQFLQAMQTIEISSDELSDFIKMASILVAMKARMLLKDQLTDEDDEVISKEALIARLVEYKKFKHAAHYLAGLEDGSFECLIKMREDLTPFQQVADDPIFGDRLLLRHAIYALFNRRHTEATPFQVKSILNIEEYSLEAIQARIRERLLSHKPFTFYDLFEQEPITKPKLIVTFLSILELTKTNELSVHQDRDSGSITVEAIES